MVENRQKWSNKWSNNRSIVFHWTSYSCQEGSLFTDIHHHISYDMYLSSHTRGIPKKSGPSDQFRTYSGPLLALRSGSGPSPEFRTLLVPLNIIIFAGEQFDLNLVLADPPPLVHCYKMGPLLGNWVPMGTFLGNWVPFLCLGSPFSILDRRM